MADKTRFIKLTKTQIDIIMHRLEIPDAMWDACEAAFEEEGMHSDEFFDRCVERVSKIIRTRFNLRDLNRGEYIVLHDAVTGSTYVDMAFDDIGFDMTHQKANAIERSYEDLLDKLEMRKY